jgi:hypothetical protein
VNHVVARVALNPNARCIQAGPGAYANAGRNTQPTRPIDNVDFSIFKKFNINERMRLDFSGQFLNLFNHPQFIPGSVDNARAVNTFTAPDLHRACAELRQRRQRELQQPQLGFQQQPPNHPGSGAL